MNLKPTLLAVGLAVACGGLAIAPAALAADGTITFNGAVNSTTCTINGGTGQNFTVTLPTVSTGTLAGSGATAGQTQFNIKLTACSAAATASTFFEQGANIDTTTGNLINSGTAKNVQVQLMNKDGTTPINLLQPSTNTTNTAVTAAGGTLTYYARYYATAASVAGSVAATENYTIVYN